MEKRLFTTFEVGQLCKVYHTTVINWINKGQLKAFTTPGKHRRIERNDLLDFIKEFNIPIPPQLKETKKILIVDDDKSILHLVEKATAKLGPSIELRSTASGIEALVMVGQDAPDLMILDVVMPGMDGIQVCRTLKANPKTKYIKILCMTGKLLDHEQESFLTHNVEALLKKPFSIRDLMGKASELLNLEVLAYANK